MHSGVGRDLTFVETGAACREVCTYVCMYVCMSLCMCVEGGNDARNC
jgi:hypothetical protein